MKTSKTFPVIMLPTEKVSCLNLTRGNTLGRWNTHIPDERLSKNQHLYILSNEKIKEGDWAIVYINENHRKVPKKITMELSEGISTGDMFYNIVATTDKSLGLPLIHDSFLPVFIKGYNERKQIKEVDLEMEYFNPALNDDQSWDGMASELYSKMKIREDNTVIILESRKYSKQEVRQIIEKRENELDAFYNNRGLVLPIDEWINENLK